MGLRLDGNNSTDTNLDVVVHSAGELYSGQVVWLCVKAAAFSQWMPMDYRTEMG